MNVAHSLKWDILAVLKSTFAILWIPKLNYFKTSVSLKENNNELIFKNKIVTFDDPRDIITRKNQLEIEILCKYQKRTNLTLEFDTHRPPVIFSEKGFGTFNYQFEFYSSGSFNNSMDPKSYPLEYNVGDKIYMQIEPVTPVPNTEIFLESCVATPYDNPNYPISYPIITNGWDSTNSSTFTYYTHVYVTQYASLLSFSRKLIKCFFLFQMQSGWNGPVFLKPQTICPVWNRGLQIHWAPWPGESDI